MQRIKIKNQSDFMLMLSSLLGVQTIKREKKMFSSHTNKKLNKLRRALTKNKKSYIIKNHTTLNRSRSTLTLKKGNKQIHKKVSPTSRRHTKPVRGREKLIHPSLLATCDFFFSSNSGLFTDQHSHHDLSREKHLLTTTVRGSNISVALQSPPSAVQQLTSSSLILSCSWFLLSHHRRAALHQHNPCNFICTAQH